MQDNLTEQQRNLIHSLIHPDTRKEQSKMHRAMFNFSHLLDDLFDSNELAYSECYTSKERVMCAESIRSLCDHLRNSIVIMNKMKAELVKFKNKCPQQWASYDYERLSELLNEETCLFDKSLNKAGQERKDDELSEHLSKNIDKMFGINMTIKNYLKYYNFDESHYRLRCILSYIVPLLDDLSSKKDDK